LTEAPPARSARARDLGWHVAIILVALNLRAVITSVPPLARDLGADLHLGPAATGALTTVPVACMGLFAPIAALATRWASQSTVLSVGVALIAVGAGLRGLGGVVGLYGATALAGIGIAVAGTLLPGLVRTHSPDRVGPVTGLYTAALIGGALVASSVADPVRSWLGVSAQLALAVWAVPAVVALAVWLPVTRSSRTPRAQRSAGAVRGATPRMPWRDRSAWLGTAFMGTQSLLFYGTLTWLAPSTMDRGMSARDAGLLLGLFSAAQVVTAFALPALAHRTGDLRPWCAASVGTTTVGLLLVAVVPDAFPAAPWLWATVLGLGMGGTFALALSAMTHLAPSVGAAPAYASMAFLVGYATAAVGPVLLGLVVARTGSFQAPFRILALLGPVAMVLGLAAGGQARGREAIARGNHAAAAEEDLHGARG
jgi:CP family cyanate transporter-like MFS transporter